ncbi:class II glutamine amidotransferase domain-containing protein [Nocardia stercoris]|uniref:ergothioneine biosynthesis protein EgtC n=1 Tax=Nocardia stercoris TaxID=2483361 RepID=UPI0038993C13
MGLPEPVGELLTRGDHSLFNQSWEPRDMRRGGTVNADGFGVAWWIRGQVAADVDAVESRTLGAQHHAPAEDGHGSVPLVASRYRNVSPIWSDPAVTEVLPQLWSTAVLAAVRSATAGMPVERSACAPFTHGRWAFSHNGTVPGWTTVLPAVAAEFGSPPLVEAESHTDSAALWVIVRGLLDSLPPPADTDLSGAVVSPSPTGVATPTPSWAAPDGVEQRQEAPASAAPQSGETATPATVLRDVVRAVLAHAPDARLNFLLSDGNTIWATAWYHSLSVLVDEEFVVVSSEPYDDDPRWQPIRDRCLVTASLTDLSVSDLDVSADRERPRP